MKTKSLILFCLLFSLFVTFPALLYSQVGDKQLDCSGTQMHFPETLYARRQSGPTNDTSITAMVLAVNADTLSKTLRRLQDFGSRFMLADNRKDIATWLMQKFISYGYTNVKLDSFINIVNQNPYHDTTMQYNVVCTIPGSSAPNEIYVIGGHYDSFSQPDPYTIAPGVDDNGSSVAATLEIARVMAKMNYQPEATIQFTLFAAEELGVFGSQYAAQKARLQGTDIRYMFSMDQIAHDPQNLNELGCAWYPDYKWATYAAVDAIERYTDLSALIFNTAFNGGSDSYSYWEQGFPPFACIEKDFSPYEHTPADTLGNCSIPYLVKVTGGALATLAEQQLFPTPQQVIAHSTKVDITLQWKPTNNARVKGVNIFRSDTTGSLYQKVNSTVVSDTVYHDLGVEQNKQYYYVLATVNDSLQESGFSQEVTGVRFNFCDTLLVLANLTGNLTTPDSVFEFYQAVLDTIPFTWQDLNATQKVTLDMLSRYRSILWISNSVNFEPADDELIHNVREFITNGGNLLYNGFNPMRFWTSGTTYPVKITEASLFHQIFKVDSIDRKVQCLMFRANAVATDYDTLKVDSLKFFDKNYPGQIYNIEVISPSSEGSIIYRLDTKYDSTTNLGKMKHRPVGLEYMGTDFKSILISFPLYYIDTNDVREFLHYVKAQKFIRPVGISQNDQVVPFSLQIYPNPVTDVCNVSFNLSTSGRVKLQLMSMQGQILNTWIDSKLEQGNHSMFFKTGPQASGLYQVVLQSNEGRAIKKVVVLR